MSEGWKDDWKAGTPDETPAQQASWFFGILLCLLLFGALYVAVFLLDSMLYYNVGKALSGDMPPVREKEWLLL